MPGPQQEMQKSPSSDIDPFDDKKKNKKSILKRIGNLVKKPSSSLNQQFTTSTTALDKKRERLPTDGSNEEEDPKRMTSPPGYQSQTQSQSPQQKPVTPFSVADDSISNSALQLNDDDMNDIIDTSYLARIAKKSEQHHSSTSTEFSSGSQILAEPYSETSGDDDDDDELMVSEYTKEWMKLDLINQKKRISGRKITSLELSTDSVLPFSLPVPVARPLSDSKKNLGSGWVAPESWVVAKGSPDTSTSAITEEDVSKSQRLQNEVMSCVRVFKREGTFVTVSCPLSISCKDLLALLAKKFFMQDTSHKIQLYIERKGVEYMIPLNERPLRLQQQLLYEIGYDFENDRFQEILREDNSYLYRWIVSDKSKFEQTTGSLSVSCPIDPSKLELKLLNLQRLSLDDALFTTAVDLSRLDLNNIPVVYFKHAKKIKEIDLSFNVMVDFPTDFAQMLSQLTVLKLSNMQLARAPKALSLIESLEVLDLSHNIIMSLKDSGLGNLKNLQELYLKNNRLMSKQSLTIDITSKWSRLRVLDLSNNWLNGELLKSVLLIGFSPEKEGPNPLEELDLSFNLLKSLPEDFGQKLKKLKKLYLNNNALSRIPNSLYGITELQVLDIRMNHIKGEYGQPADYEESTAAPKLSNLTKLILDNNHFHELKFCARCKFDKLETIVSHRNTNLLQVTFTEPLPALTTLILCSAKLAFLPDDIFSCTPQLKVLLLNTNHLTTLPPSLYNLKHLTRLEVINNSLNRLSSVKELQSLECLDLRGNNLKEIPVEIWELKLKYLNLSSNVIEVFPEPSFGFEGHRGTFNSKQSMMQLPKESPLDVSASAAAAIVRSSSSVHLPSVSTSNGTNLAFSLEMLAISDNRLESNFFEQVAPFFFSLKYLNVAHNDIFSVPANSIRGCSSSLEELILSGNHLTQLPEDISYMKKLKRLYLNNNRIGSIPPDLGKNFDLRVLDMGRNQLRYNVNNWPYDWNWNWNLELRYLNLSGNSKLEIRPLDPNTALNASTVSVVRKREKSVYSDDFQTMLSEKGDISKFDNLSKMRLLSLMDVGVLVPLPDEHAARRVRISGIGGSSAHWKKHAGIDDGLASQITESDRQQAFVGYGIADCLGDDEKSNAWDLVLLNTKFLKIAKDEAGDVSDQERRNRSECIFGLFDAYQENGAGSWCSKWLNESFVGRFASELKKIVKERKSGANENIAKSSDPVLIQHALRRTFLLINKHIGGLTYKSSNKSSEQNPSQAEDELSSSAIKRRKQSVQLEAPIHTKLKKKGSASSGSSSSSALNVSARRRKSSFSGVVVPLPHEKNLTDLQEDEEPLRHSTARTAKTDKKSAKPSNTEENDYWTSSDVGEDDEEFNEDSYARLLDSGLVGLVAYIVNQQLFVANCGDAVAVLCRQGNAIPLSTKHTLSSIHSTASTQKSVAATKEDESGKAFTAASSKSSADDTKQKKTSKHKQEIHAKKELLRIRETGGHISHDGKICDKTFLTRAFGFYHILPHVNANPHISVTDLTESDEFLIIASGAFWNTMSYQTAVDVARLKADDALEAALVLRDFAMAYSDKYVYAASRESELSEEGSRKNDRKKFRKREAMTVMVINIREWLGYKSKRIFTKIKRRRDETVDSAIARLAPEVEPPTGFVALVFTDVRNSTQLWEKKPLSMRVAIREHNVIMRRNLRFFNGYEVKTEGDAFMVAFKNVVDALTWCMHVQMQLLEADWPSEILESPDCVETYGPNSLSDGTSDKALLYRGLSIRMGVHCGSPVTEMDPITRRMDYFGPVVNKTARICNAAEGGQILVSQDVEKAFKNQTMNESIVKRNANNAERARNISSLEHQFISVGERKLKGLDNPEILVSLLPKPLIGRHVVPPPAIPMTETAVSPPSVLAPTFESADSGKLTSLSDPSLSPQTDLKTLTSPSMLRAVFSKSEYLLSDDDKPVIFFPTSIDAVPLNLRELSQDESLLSHYADRIEAAAIKLGHNLLASIRRNRGISVEDAETTELAPFASHLRLHSGSFTHLAATYGSSSAHVEFITNCIQRIEYACALIKTVVSGSLASFAQEDEDHLVALELLIRLATNSKRVISRQESFTQLPE